jgi:hypothetical protein
MPRPRKTQDRDGTPGDISPLAVLKNDSVVVSPEAVSPVEPALSPPQQPTRRPRGRPRKYPLPMTAPLDSSRPLSIPTAVPPSPAPDISHPPVDEAAPTVRPSAMDRIEAIIRKAEARDGTAPVKRPRGRPRKNPLSGIIQRSEQASVKPAGHSGMLTPVPLENGPDVRTEPAVPARPVHTGASPQHLNTDPAEQPPARAADDPRPSRRQRLGAQPPEAFPRPRGRRPKDRIPPFTIAPGNQSPFCPKCGTYIRLFKPKRGRWRRVCPRCQPQRLIERRDPRFNLDKTGIPCKDRGKCRPERCVKALECTEMARKGGIRGSSHKKAG